ncbi:hypothetical protein DFJ74DRAFT_772775 [Hyaloraphidium curvatum]|nr:hypothetical protein DFJ74DRAFT_772775 [Hyaloraphidium curvatum]
MADPAGAAPASPTSPASPFLIQTDFTFTGDTYVEPLVAPRNKLTVSPVLHPVPPPDPSVPVPALPEHRGLSGAIRPWAGRLRRRTKEKERAEGEGRGRGKRILFVTDTYLPSVNGVVTTIRNLIIHAQKLGHEVHIIEPSQFTTVGFPAYPEVRLALTPWLVGLRIIDVSPDAIHIFTEGPLGGAARIFCCKREIPFTTSYHTRFPEYLDELIGLPAAVCYPFLSWFHRPTRGCLVPTAGVKRDLEQRLGDGIALVPWTRGVDAELFCPAMREAAAEAGVYAGLRRPVILCVSRISREKNVEEFCALDDSLGTKVLVGEGPQRAYLEKKYGKRVIFTGLKLGRELAMHFAGADVLVFTSKSDTFGNVMIEAMACGTPVAAHYVTGPKDVIDPGVTGYMLPTGLADSIHACLDLDRAAVVRAAREKWTLEVMGRIFMDNLARVHDRRRVYVRRAPFRNSGLRYVLAGIALAVYRSVLGDGRAKGPLASILATLGSFLITIYFLLIVPFTTIDDQ